MSTSVDKRFGRRSAVLSIGAAVGSAAVGGAVASVAGRQVPSEPLDPQAGLFGSEPLPDSLATHGLTAPSEEVSTFFGPLTPGTRLESHWRIEGVFEVRAGAIPVILATRSGRRFAVEILRVGPGAEPLARAANLGLYLVNRGNGTDPTDEATGLGVMALGRALNERIAAGAPIPLLLTTMAERRAEHPTGIFHIPV